MNEYTASVADSTKMSLIEINNNLALRNIRKISQVSVSSASSYQSDSSEDNLTNLERKASLQDIKRTEDREIQSEYQRCRSMSDSVAAKLRNDDPFFEVFPSLPNSVLEKLGLRGDGPRERLNEEELEQKFTTLALAFTIDSATIKDRCERQRRYRDQTEKNLSVEIERLKEKLALMQPLCTDYETAELLSTLLTQVDIIMKATALVSISAERYGSVQHEERLTESVILMVSHVQLLKQQRDSARRQFQYTKRVLQNADSTVNNPVNSQKTNLPMVNRKVLGRRRSIATFSQLENKPLVDVKKITRKTSEVCVRSSSLTRNGRLSRLELGGELVKIKEGFISEMVSSQGDDFTKEAIIMKIDNSSLSNTENSQPPVRLENLSMRGKIRYKFRKMRQTVEEKYTEWTNDGTIHEMCCFCALLCFSLSLLTMINILIEYEYSKRGLGTSYIFWTVKKYSTEKN